MLDWLRGILQPPKAQRLPLFFELDEADQHVLRVYKRVGDQRELVKDPRKLAQYGYREEAEDGRTFYVPSADDRDTLLSVMSLNPEANTNDGSLRFEIVPPVLRYLRKKENLAEGEHSKRLVISDKLARPAAKVDFDPAKGGMVRTGYAEEGSDEIIPAASVRTTADGGYARLGNTFVPLPKKLSETARGLLEKAIWHVPIHDIPEFFQRDLVLIKKEFNAVLTDGAAKVQVIDQPLQPLVRIDKTVPGWLDFHVDYQAAGYTLPYDLLARNAGQKFVRLEGSTWVANDPRALATTAREIQELGAEPTVDGYRLPASQFASLEEFIQAIGGRAEVSAAYREFLDQLSGFRGDESYKLPAPFEQHLRNESVQLRPYQRAGAHWLHWLQTNHLHGILADDMGLGKTLQSICVLRQAYEETGCKQHSLIVAPKSVLGHWERELRRFYPKMQVYRYHGPKRRRQLLQADRPIAFITTYATVANDVEDLARTPFFYVILDEATQIKNPQARRSEATKALNAAHRLALTGTPIENRPAELWSMYDFLMRGHLGRYGTFSSQFEQAIMAGDHSAAERLGRRIHPFLLRRLKADVAKYLPEKIEINEWCELTEEQRQLYGALQDRAKVVRDALQRGEDVNYTTNILPIITHLKQICDHPAIVSGQAVPIEGRSEKFDWIMDKIEEIAGSREQVVVFSHFLRMMDLLQASLADRQITCIRIDGSTNNRQKLIDSFNAKHATVALCSLRAAGHGINLTSASNVIHADRWWNPAVEDQATDRVHRIGQDRPVYVYRILTEGTLEERIDHLLQAKRGMADEVVGAAARGGMAWTREELLELLRPLD